MRTTKKTSRLRTSWMNCYRKNSAYRWFCIFFFFVVVVSIYAEGVGSPRFEVASNCTENFRKSPHASLVTGYLFISLCEIEEGVGIRHDENK